MQHISCFDQEHEIAKAFNATNIVIMVINTNRQIVFANQALYALLKTNNPGHVLGKRPGEVVKCIHSHKGPNGCGSTPFCEDCTALEIIQRSMTLDQADSGEAIITTRFDNDESSMNIYEYVQPIDVHEQRFYVISMMDISDRVQRRFLERIFFHDILNTVGALKGLIGVVQSEVNSELQSEMDIIRTYFDYVIEELQAQKQLLEAENQELHVDVTTLNSLEILQSVKKVYSRLEEYKNYTINIDDASDEIIFRSDFVLLRRVIANMLKNALEASSPGQSIVVGCRRNTEESRLEFWVKNFTVMPDEIQKRIFERSFSSKGKGRGLGTYSIKLLGEKYLKGKVSFTSDVHNGTVFYLTIPVTYPENTVNYTAANISYKH